MVRPNTKLGIRVDFYIIAREGSFSDTVQANYNVRGVGSSFIRYANQEAGSAIQNTNYFGTEVKRVAKNELTVGYEGVSPKTLSFDMHFESSQEESSQDIVDKISQLQSLCYPEKQIFYNPPLCRLVISNLYDLECWVQDVNVTWLNTWRLQEGLPRGASVTTTVLQYAYPTFEEVRSGAGFKANQRNYSGAVLKQGDRQRRRQNEA